MLSPSKNWCAFHRINFDCDDWCSKCQEALVEGITDRCLIFLEAARTEIQNTFAQSAMQSSLSTDTKSKTVLNANTKTPQAHACWNETEIKKSQNSALTAGNSNLGTCTWHGNIPHEISYDCGNWERLVDIKHITTAHHLIRKTFKNGWSWGLLFRWGSLWVGGHYSYKEKRYCLNLLPCLTIWFTKPGGAIPYIA